METVALQTDLDKLAKRLKGLASLQQLKDLSHDVMDKISREEWRVLENQIKYLKTDVTNSMSRDEINQRINVLMQEINSQLNVRPTFDNFREVIDA